MTSSRKSLRIETEAVSSQLFILIGTLFVIAAMTTLVGW